MSDKIKKEKDITDSNTKYTPPEYKKNAFHCPHCEVHAHQSWYETFKYNEQEIVKNLGYQLLNDKTFKQIIHLYPAYFYIQDVRFSFCDHCKKYSIWVDSQMVYPHLSTAPMPIAEMPESVKKIYNEARGISDKSPKAACALLRLGIEKLLEELKVNGNDLNNKIGNLVQKNLSKRVQKALDIVRVIGNNAVHPGKIDIDDNPKVVNSLFKLINIICEKTIKEDQEIDNLFDGLPKNQKDAISQRDFYNKENN